MGSDRRRLDDAPRVADLDVGAPGAAPVSPDEQQLVGTIDPSGTLHLVGEADMATEHVVRAALEELCQGAPPHRIDLRGLEFADARSIGLLAEAAAPPAVHLVLLSPRPLVARVIEILRLAALPNVDIEDA